MLKGSSNSDQMRRKPQQARSIERVNHILKIADQVFALRGFEAATTIEIAARAKMSVGSLYRFFPDKAAILKALAGSYLEQLQQAIAKLHSPEAVHLPLSVYVDRANDAFNQFFIEHPGFRSVFVHSHGASSEVLAMQADVDRQIAKHLATFYALRAPNLEPEQCELIALVTVAMVSKLHVLSLTRDEAFREQVMAEVRKSLLAYLQLYLADC
ncbi:MAG TPA: TetR/AcrR family transcriptional regulator [Coleofasciculaceae cyanobacterium]|jgi:AcrR family transcriptional regulator